MCAKVTVSTKGHLIDSHCKYNTGTIFELDGLVYDCTLNQTEIGSNKNKFYIMQLIQTGSNYVVYIRYGRIGITGTMSYKEYTMERQAVDFFEKQFRFKTGNSWYEKDKFVKKEGKYFMSDIECADVSEESGDEEDEKSECDLDNKVVDFVKLISNMVYMKNNLVQLEIDVEKMPLGKISSKQIDEAGAILNEINENIKKSIKSIFGDPNSPNNQKFVSLSSSFYTLIPYACGMKKPPIINTLELVGKYINLLNELSQLAIGTGIITKMKNGDNISKIYDEMHTKIEPMDKSDEMYQILVDYLYNSKASTHNFDFQILDVYKIGRDNERETYIDYTEGMENKTLLFHGTRISNIISVLKNGLIVDPSKLGINVSITGKMFGMGLYFANSCSKSIQYCAYDTSDNIACLFVAEVALGKMLKKKQSDSSLTAKTLPRGYHSTWGMGSSSFNEFDEYAAEEDDDIVRVPSGKLKKTSVKGCSLMYDEFIVYHEEQVNLKYIIKLKIGDDSDSE